MDDLDDPAELQLAPLGFSFGGEREDNSEGSDEERRSQPSAWKKYRDANIRGWRRALAPWSNNRRGVHSCEKKNQRTGYLHLIQ